MLFECTGPEVPTLHNRPDLDSCWSLVLYAPRLRTPNWAWLQGDKCCQLMEKLDEHCLSQLQTTTRRWDILRRLARKHVTYKSAQQRVLRERDSTIEHWRPGLRGCCSTVAQ
jgi:hypothetical protein